jgi:hypothetical protein
MPVGPAVRALAGRERLTHREAIVSRQCPRLEPDSRGNGHDGLTANGSVTPHSPRVGNGAKDRGRHQNRRKANDVHRHDDGRLWRTSRQRCRHMHQRRHPPTKLYRGEQQSGCHSKGPGGAAQRALQPLTRAAAPWVPCPCANCFGMSAEKSPCDLHAIATGSGRHTPSQTRAQGTLGKARELGSEVVGSRRCGAQRAASLLP